MNRDDALARPNGRREVAAAICRALCGWKVRYSAPLYNPDLAQQDMRDPDTILDGAGLGTCLDLAIWTFPASSGWRASWLGCAPASCEPYGGPRELPQQPSVARCSLQARFRG